LTKLLFLFLVKWGPLLFVVIWFVLRVWSFVFPYSYEEMPNVQKHFPTLIKANQRRTLQICEKLYKITQKRWDGVGTNSTRWRSRVGFLARRSRLCSFFWSARRFDLFFKFCLLSSRIIMRRWKSFKDTLLEKRTSICFQWRSKEMLTIVKHCFFSKLTEDVWSVGLVERGDVTVERSWRGETVLYFCVPV
jgi:hypothetical protein